MNKILLQNDIDYGTFQENNILPLLKDKFNKEMIKYMIVKVLMMIKLVFNNRKRRGKIFGKL